MRTLTHAHRLHTPHHVLVMFYSVIYSLHVAERAFFSHLPCCTMQAGVIRSEYRFVLNAHERLIWRRRTLRASRCTQSIWVWTNKRQIKWDSRCAELCGSSCRRLHPQVGPDLGRKMFNMSISRFSQHRNLNRLTPGVVVSFALSCTYFLI